jgi:hypothetical protein
MGAKEGNELCVMTDRVTMTILFWANEKLLLIITHLDNLRTEAQHYKLDLEDK